jgi:hypothetical protein
MTEVEQNLELIRAEIARKKALSAPPQTEAGHPPIISVFDDSFEGDGIDEDDLLIEEPQRIAVTDSALPELHAEKVGVSPEKPVTAEQDIPGSAIKGRSAGKRVLSSCAAAALIGFVAYTIVFRDTGSNDSKNQSAKKANVASSAQVPAALLKPGTQQKAMSSATKLKQDVGQKSALKSPPLPAVSSEPPKEKGRVASLSASTVNQATPDSSKRVIKEREYSSPQKTIQAAIPANKRKEVSEKHIRNVKSEKPVTPTVATTDGGGDLDDVITMLNKAKSLN